MRRTELKRGGRLKTYKPLERKTPMKRTKMTKAVKAKRQKDRTLARSIANVQSAYWERKAKKVWREAVFIICNYACIVCNRADGQLDGHHIFSRSRKLTRWNPMNGVVLCPLHHMYDKALSAHYGAPGFFTWLAGHLPGRFAWIADKRHELHDPDILKSYDYKADYELAREIIDENRDYNWLCYRLGLHPEQDQEQ